MTKHLPRVAAVAADSPTRLRVTWRGRGPTTVELAGWIATGGEILAPLRDAETFKTARVGDHGAWVEWGADNDLAIDAVHLMLLGEEQVPFGRADLETWQELSGLSNQESADLFGIGLSTWNNYRAGANIPTAIRMVCRAALRDPILLQAHYRPRKVGRPRKTA